MRDCLINERAGGGTAPPRYEYFRPRKLEEVWQVRAAHPDSRFVAGGTDLLVKIRQRAIVPPAALISLRGIAELAGIEAGDRFRIGAMTPIAVGLADRELTTTFPALAKAAGSIGSTQIRTVGTFGGNFCNASPCADLATPLLAYDAHVELLGPDGTRTVPLTDFFVGPGQTCLAADELLVAILVERPPSGARALFQRRSRVGMDLAQASLTILVEINGDRCRKARVAAGAVAPTPLRLTEVEQLLDGSRIDDDLIARAGDLAAAGINPIDDIRASAAYRRQLINVFVRRGLTALAAEEPA